MAEEPMEADGNLSVCREDDDDKGDVENMEIDEGGAVSVAECSGQTKENPGDGGRVAGETNGETECTENRGRDDSLEGSEQLGEEKEERRKAPCDTPGEEREDPKEDRTDNTYDSERSILYTDPDEGRDDESDHAKSTTSSDEGQQGCLPNVQALLSSHDTRGHPAQCPPRVYLPQPLSWSSHDTRRYRAGYPGKKDDLSLDKNYLFYINKIPYEPHGVEIDNFHEFMWGQYGQLEWNHSYIQWLFPIREQGMNWHAQELQLHEIEKILGNEKAKARLMTSYKLMLDFYGITMDENGVLCCSKNCEQRFQNLNRSSHNYLRITRILKCLGEFEMEDHKVRFIEFMLKHAIKTGRLRNVLRSCMCYWVEVLRNDTERERMWALAREMVAEVDGQHASSGNRESGRAGSNEHGTPTAAITTQPTSANKRRVMPATPATQPPCETNEAQSRSTGGQTRGAGDTENSGGDAESRVDVSGAQLPAEVDCKEKKSEGNVENKDLETLV